VGGTNVLYIGRTHIGITNIQYKKTEELT